MNIKGASISTSFEIKSEFIFTSSFPMKFILLRNEKSENINKLSLRDSGNSSFIIVITDSTQGEHVLFKIIKTIIDLDCTNSDNF